MLNCIQYIDVNSVSQESGAAKKPGALESLSKEELIGKCKTLLQIAQKAKKAKDGEFSIFF